MAEESPERDFTELIAKGETADALLAAAEALVACKDTNDDEGARTWMHTIAETRLAQFEKPATDTMLVFKTLAHRNGEAAVMQSIVNAQSRRCDSALRAATDALTMSCGLGGDRGGVNIAEVRPMPRGLIVVFHFRSSCFWQIRRERCD
uniref:Uncharacterized protein n=1 Tax=Noctiluca scintillans TaxID=2966 RepID=A0A7S1FKX8_NOCSC|mmetsp:Transcript_9308/g.25980  ORF Transcript_9308/g.25980 Transcript_9308/m.25980 type:complete len:149 (+) Transcript_9308:66-512(+)